MSTTFSALHSTPFCYLDLDELGYSIYDLDNSSARQYAKYINDQFLQVNPCGPYDDHADGDFCGSNWPIGLTESQLVHFHYCTEVDFLGIYVFCDTTTCEYGNSTGAANTGTHTMRGLHRYVPNHRFELNDCGDGTDFAVDKPYIYLSALSLDIPPFIFPRPPQKCAGERQVWYSGTWNSEFCTFSTDEGVPQYIHRTFFEPFGSLADPDFGIPGLVGLTPDNAFPAIIKKNDLYWPSFQFGAGVECADGASDGAVTFTSFNVNRTGLTWAACGYGAIIPDPMNPPNPFPNCPPQYLDCGSRYNESCIEITTSLILKGPFPSVPLKVYFLSGNNSAEQPCPPPPTGCELTDHNYQAGCVTFSAHDAYGFQVTGTT